MRLSNNSSVSLMLVFTNIFTNVGITSCPYKASRPPSKKVRRKTQENTEDKHRIIKDKHSKTHQKSEKHRKNTEQYTNTQRTHTDNKTETQKKIRKNKHREKNL